MAEQNDSARAGERRIATLLANRRDEILNLWIKERLENDEFRDELISKKDLRQQSRQVLDMLVQGVQDSGGGDFDHPAFDDLRHYLNEISHLRAVKGYTPMENATYILSLRNVIGTLDSRRAQMMMEALLQKVVETGSTIAILDITGVRTMDTLVANHLIKTVTAARLMGARCILTGVSPAI